MPAIAATIAINDSSFEPVDFDRVLLGRGCILIGKPLLNLPT
jgi:hypothetical protein